MRSKEDKPKKHWLTEFMEAEERRRGEYIRSRFFVVEVIPAKRYMEGNGHGGYEVAWTSQKVQIVSPYFDTEEEAQKFLDAHEPDEGCRLEIKANKLYRKTVEKWY